MFNLLSGSELGTGKLKSLLSYGMFKLQWTVCKDQGLCIVHYSLSNLVNGLFVV